MGRRTARADDQTPDPDGSFGAAGRLIIATRFEDMWRHHSGTLEGDADALHDMRVGSRRLRAALDVFAPAFHGGEYRRLHHATKRLTDELGAVRDHDVMLGRLRRYRKAAPRGERAGIEDLSAALTVERTVARLGLVQFFARLDDDGYAARMRRLCESGADAYPRRTAGRHKHGREATRVEAVSHD